MICLSDQERKNSFLFHLQGLQFHLCFCYQSLGLKLRTGVAAMLLKFNVRYYDY